MGTLTEEDFMPKRPGPDKDSVDFATMAMQFVNEHGGPAKLEQMHPIIQQMYHKAKIIIFKTARA